RQAELAPVVVLSTLRQEADYNGLMCATACIDAAQRHIGMSEATSFVARAELNIKSCCLGTCRKDKRRMRAFILGTDGNGLTNEYCQGHRQRNYGDKVRRHDLSPGQSVRGLLDALVALGETGEAWRERADWGRAQRSSV